MDYQDLVRRLETKRKHSLTGFVIWTVVASIIGVGGFASVVIGGILGFMWLAFLGGALFLFGTPAPIFAAMRQKNAYLAYFQKEVAPLFAQGLYDSFAFDMKKNIESLKKEMPLAMKRRPDDEAASYYEGVYHGIPFFSYAYDYSAKGKGHPRLAYGRYYQMKLPKTVPGDILIVNKATAPLVKSSQIPVPFHSESILFEQRHLFAAKDEMEAMTIVQPLFTDSAVSIEEEAKGHLSFAFKENDLLIYLDDYLPKALVTLTHAVTAELLEGYRQELLLPSRFLASLQY